jgi:hypothetical protein
MKVNLKVCQYCARYKVNYISHKNMTTTQYACRRPSDGKCYPTKQVTVAWQTGLPHSVLHLMEVSLHNNNCEYLLEHVVSKGESK